MKDDFVIPVSKLTLLKQYEERICGLFGVSLEEIPSEDSQEPQTWIRVSSETSEQDVQRAKEYIITLVSENTHSRPEVKNCYNSQHFETLLQYRDQIEASSRAILTFSPANFSICIRGLQMHIDFAQSYIKNILQREVVTLTQGEDQSVKGTVVGPSIGITPGGSAWGQYRSRGDGSATQASAYSSFMSPLSPGSASERDSCYHSDDDPCTFMYSYADIVSSNFTSPNPQRTRCTTSTSPTFQTIDVSTGAEINTSRTSSPPVSPQGQGHSGSGSTSSSSDDMAKEVEFGIKLGYAEAEIHSAMRKLVNPSTNQLLEELVKSSSATQSGTETKDKLQTEDLEQDGSNSLDMSISTCSSGPLAAVISSQISSSTGLDPSWSQETLPLDSCAESLPDVDGQRYSDGNIEYRYIVIDGSNVAMSHGNKECFSCRGIKLAVDWFKQKGCRDITVFVPQWRKESSRPDAQITDQHILMELEKERVLTFTPSRRIGGKRMVCYDDRYVLQLALEEDGIIVSNDNYRDLQTENPEFKRIVEERLLMYSFVIDKFMPPGDPLGRRGPTLENFLRKQPMAPVASPIPCPYGKKCTYGNKCKYHHPERGNQPHKSVTEKLAEESKQKMLEVKERGKSSEEKRKSGGKKHKQPGAVKRELSRTNSVGVSDSIPPPVPPRILKPTTKGKEELPALPVDVPIKPEILVSPSREQDSEYRAYNDKLSELRKKIEIHERTARESCPPPDSVDMPVHPGYIDPAQWSRAGIQSPGRGSPAREQLVCGHLSLAQTLSDEANRQQLQKDLRDRNPSPSGRAFDIQQQQQALKQSLQQQSLSQQQPLQLQQPPIYGDAFTSQHGMQQSQHQKLSRTRSIQDGGLYPPTNPAVFASQMSVPEPYRYQSDPRHFHCHGGIHRAGGAKLRPELFYNHGHYSLGSSTEQVHLPSYPGAFPNRQTSYGVEFPEVFLDHSDLSRTNSDTSQLPLMTKAPGFPPMRRQNSTSDPVLNRHSGEQSGVPQHLSGSGVSMYEDRVSNLVLDDRPASQPTHYQHQHVLGSDPYGMYGVGSVGYQQRYPEVAGTYQRYPSTTPPVQTPLAPVMMSSSPHIRSGYPPEARIEPTDPRYNLYYHLCGLFPEPSVRAVMNQYPMETNPRVLCQFLM